MPTQEDRVLTRLKVMQAMIRDSKTIEYEKFFAWAFITLGLRERTVAQHYLKNLSIMGLIKLDKTAILWVGNNEG